MEGLAALTQPTARWLGEAVGDLALESRRSGRRSRGRAERWLHRDLHDCLAEDVFELKLFGAVVEELVARRDLSCYVQRVLDLPLRNYPDDPDAHDDEDEEGKDAEGWDNLPQLRVEIVLAGVFAELLEGGWHWCGIKHWWLGKGWWGWVWVQREIGDGGNGG